MDGPQLGNTAVDETGTDKADGKRSGRKWIEQKNAGTGKRQNRQQQIDAPSLITGIFQGQCVACFPQAVEQKDNAHQKRNERNDQIIAYDDKTAA